jgi:hypothetical protein
VSLLTDVRHDLARVGAALGAGIVAGGVTGLGARLAMFVIRLQNDSHNGEVTHELATVGRVTLEGTVNLIVQGMVYGVAGVVVYVAVRRWMPGRGVVKGVAFGLFLLVVFGQALLDGNYEYFRYVSPVQAVLLFAALYPLFGAVVGLLTERWTRLPEGPPGNRIVAVAGWVVLGAAVVWGAVADYGQLRDVYHLYG